MAVSVIGYDGSFPGFLCAADNGGYLMPEAEISCRSTLLVPILSRQPALFECDKTVTTSLESARKIYIHLRRKIGFRGMSLLHHAHLSIDAGGTRTPNQLETSLIKFIRLGLIHGPKVIHMLSDPAVGQVVRTATAVERELNRYTGILRFTKTTSALFRADCAPRYDIVPLLGKHFVVRMGNDYWLIVDKVRKFGLFHFPGEYETHNIPILQDVETICANSKAKDPEEYPRLWKSYFEAMGIEERKNSRCQKSFVPVMDRIFMTEFQ